jgi:hypothetical protein
MKLILCCALLFAACGISQAQGQDGCNHCDRCGCAAPCRKVCRCVDDVKKVPKITYSCKCEDFCVPGRSEHCVVCDDCGHKQHIYTPTCAEVRTRTKLVKHETVKEVPSHKWVVETLCDACACKCAGQNDGMPTPAGDASAQDETDNVMRTSFHSPSKPTREGTATPAEKTAVASGFKSGVRRVLQPFFGQK